MSEKGMQKLITVGAMQASRSSAVRGEHCFQSHQLNCAPSVGQSAAAFSLAFGPNIPETCLQLVPGTL